MTTAGRPLGSAALLRVGGLPVAFWSAAGAPELLAQVERLVDAEGQLRSAARDLAVRLGTDLVTDPAVPRDARRLLLDLRRRLHRGDPVGGTDLRALPSSLRSAPADATLHALTAHVRAERPVGEQAARLTTAVDAEVERLVGLPRLVRDGSAVARAVVPATLVPSSADPPTRAARRRAAHARRLVARAATVATPRGWFSHVGLVQVTDRPGADDAHGTHTLGVGPRYAAHWTQDVRTARRSASAPSEDWPAPATPLALDPLQWTDGDRLVSVVLDHHDHPVQAVVRRTDLLDAVCSVLTDGARTFGGLAAALGCTRSDDVAGLRGFVRHLVGAGVLQAGSTPATVLIGDARPDAPAVDGRAGWVDVHRDVTGTLARGDVTGLQAAVLEALAVLDLATSRGTDGTRSVLPDGTWTLADVLAAELDARRRPDAPGTSDTTGLSGAHRATAPPSPGAAAAPPPSPLADLLRATARATPPGRPLVLDRARLADAGATVPTTLAWPVDCLVRVPAPGTEHPAVLEQVWPSGVLDSRFAHGLTALHGDLPHVAGYRAFLRRLESLTGTLVVEILAPPLSDGAANAVRRPAGTGAWTGDPHAAAYTGTPPGRYVPLGAIRVERRAGRLSAWAGGRRLWPVYHATRSLSPPWDRVAEVLLAAAPVAARVPRDLLAVVTVPDGMTSLPRVEVSGGLVLAGAQWLVGPAELPSPGDALDQRLRTLVRLRRGRGLPRWVWLVPPGDAPAVACDLLGLDALDTLAHRTTPVARLVEMLPRPDALAVHDAAHGGRVVVSQLHLRFPTDETPEALAERLAPQVRAAVRRPTRPATVRPTTVRPTTGAPVAVQPVTAPRPAALRPRPSVGSPADATHRARAPPPRPAPRDPCLSGRAPVTDAATHDHSCTTSRGGNHERDRPGSRPVRRRGTLSAYP